MKLLHLADLHLGKRVYAFSMLEDQEFILREILEIADRERPDCVILAGDIYDRAVPPTEAVELFDRFLVELAGRGLPVFVISGNHDSPERLAFGGRLMDPSGVHLSPVYDGTAAHFRLSDEYGEVHLYLLPFLRPAHVRRFYPEETIDTYTDAVRTAVAQMHLDPSARNVLAAHQFFTGAVRSESEEISVGGLDSVDASVLEGFDYVALGHIHTPQNIGSDRIRYAGTPLKYSFSEARREKSVTIAELGPKGTRRIREIPLTPLRDLRELRGTFETLTARPFHGGVSCPSDYVHITLTDEEDIPNAAARLRAFYPNLMKLDYDNTRTRHDPALREPAAAEQRSPLALFSDFYEQCCGAPMSEEQAAYLRKAVETIWEGET